MALSKHQEPSFNALTNDIQNALNEKVSADLKFDTFVALSGKLPFDWGIWAKFEFQGLDPEKVFRHMVMRAKALDKTLKQMIVDIQNIMSWYVRRGTNTSDNIRSTKEGFAEIKKLKEAYQIGNNIKDSRKGTNAEGITMGRVAATFIEMAMVHYVLGTATPITEHPGLPRSFAFIGSPAMMRNKEWDAYRTAYLTFALKVHRILNQKDDKQMAKTDETVSKEQLMYVTNARQSNFNKIHFKRRRNYVAAMVENIVKNKASQPDEFEITPDNEVTMDVLQIKDNELITNVGIGF